MVFFYLMIIERLNRYGKELARVVIIRPNALLRMNVFPLFEDAGAIVERGGGLGRDVHGKEVDCEADRGGGRPASPVRREGDRIGIGCRGSDEEGSREANNRRGEWSETSPGCASSLVRVFEDFHFHSDFS